MIRTRRLVVIAAALGLLLAACSSSSSSSSSAAAPPTTAAATVTTRGHLDLAAIGAATATGMTLSLARGPQGIFLIGPNGHSLYVFAKDTGTTSACTGRCATVWPAITATGTITTGPDIDKAEVTTVHGQVADQLAYYGHLLYTFSGDAAPGQTKGVGIPDWNLLGPFGNVMLPRG
jgi:predicted lipoprotein with Yx(FWY)xxD motif